MTVQPDPPVCRQRLLADFLKRNGCAAAALVPLADDCSFRRYFRLAGRGLLVMDAPPDREDVRPFVAVAGLLAGLDYSVPRIDAVDADNGFLLIEDLGDATFTRALAAGADERALYRLATDLLVDLHRRDPGGIAGAANLPRYSDGKLLDEAMLFVDWYLDAGLGLRLPDSARAAYGGAWSDCMTLVRQSPETLVLRDYHVDNLMVLNQRDGLRGCGLLDFQDAVIGPASYDLVSLLQDSRRDIAPEVVDDMLQQYLSAFGDSVDPAQFMSSYRALGAQRALKVFGIFTRQSVLYGNHAYLAHIPRLWRHVLADLEPPELEPVRAWIDRHVPLERRVMPGPDRQA